MTLKNQPNGPNLRRPGLPAEGPRQLIELNPALGMEPGTKEATAFAPMFGHPALYRPVLSEVLEADDYQVVLVSRAEWNRLERSEVSTPSILSALNWEEFVSRVFDFVRDPNGAAERKTVQFADFRVDFTSMEVRRFSGERIALTSQEFRTLRCFLLNPERVFTRAELLNQAWGYEHYPSTRTVDNHVLKLRRKFEKDPSRPLHFRTVHGVGYKFVP